MKLISWNVNGLRAVMGKGFDEAMAALDADVICLQETKVQAGQAEVTLPGYHQYWNYAEKKGYSGTAIFTRQERDKMTQLLDSGYIDTFRHFHPEETGAYSWWSYMYHAREKNAGWRIDYFLASRRLEDKLVSACIHPEIMGSDHCPVELVAEV